MTKPSLQIDLMEGWFARDDIVHNLEVEMLEKVLERYKEELIDIKTSWQRVDTKSQAVIGISGIFIAASGNFSNNASITSNEISKTLFASIIVLLVLAVAFAMMVLRLQSIKNAGTGNILEDMTRDLINSRDFFVIRESEVDFLNDQIRLFSLTIENYLTGYKKKTFYLSISQYLAFIALVIFAGLVLWSILYT